MDRNDYARQVIYDAIARLLPTMGRDFNVKIACETASDNRIKTSVCIIPLTNLGRAIVPHIRDNINMAIREVVKEAPNDWIEG
jgi:hypothetical protein